METCTPRPNISIRSAHSVPNLYFEVNVNRTYESSLKNAEEVLKECDESSIEESYSNCNGYDLSKSNNNIISQQEIEIVIPFSDGCDDPFQRNTARKSRKRYRAPPPPAAISQKTLPNTKYARNRNPSLDLLIVKSGSSHSDLNNDGHHDADSEGTGFGNRSDDIRMSVLQRKAILEKQLKLRVNGPVEDSLQTSHMKEIGPERKHLMHKDNLNESEGVTTTKTVDVQKEIKRPFIPPPPPPPKVPPVTQTTNHPRQQNESGVSTEHSDDKDERNGCDTCVDWLLFLLCIA